MEKINHNEPQLVEVKGHKLECPICSNKHFWSREAQLNKAISSLFNLDWTDRSATCYVCSECTYIFWFLEEDE